MPKTTPLQHSFSSGELSPKMLARSDLVPFAQGTRVLDNFVTKPRGPIKSRDGFRFLGDII